MAPTQPAAVKRAARITKLMADPEIKAALSNLAATGTDQAARDVIETVIRSFQRLHYHYTRKLGRRKDGTSTRARQGERHGRARLTEADVISLRAWAHPYLQAGETPPWSQKAREIKMAESTVRDIVYQRTWSHL